MNKPLEQHIAFVQQSVQRALERIYQRQRDSTTRRLGGKRGRQMAKRFPEVDSHHIFDEAFWRDDIYHWATSWHEMIFLLVALSSRNQAIPLNDSRIEVDIDRYAHAFASTIAHTVTRRLTETLIQALNGSADDDDLHSRVGLVFQELHDQAAEQARSMVAKACNDAATTLYIVPT